MTRTIDDVPQDESVAQIAAEDEKLISHNFVPAEMSDEERKQALEYIAEQENEKSSQDAKDDKSGRSKYFRSLFSGLSVVVGTPDYDKGEVAPKVVRFQAFQEIYKGDPRKVGYLATSNPVAIKKLEVDPNVERITKKQYDDFMAEVNDPENRETIKIHQ